MRKTEFNIFIRSFVVSNLVLLCPLFLLSAVSVAYQNIRYMAFGETKQAITLLADGTVKILDFKFNLVNISWLQYPAAVVNQLISGPIRLICLGLIWIRDNISSLVMFLK